MTKAALTKHWYISTACQHLKHRQCRETCKFCDAPCQCPHHRGEIDPDPPITWERGEPMPEKLRELPPPEVLENLEAQRKS